MCFSFTGVSGIVVRYAIRWIVTECFRPDCNDIIDARYERTLTSTYRFQKRSYHVIKMGVRFRSGKTHRVDQENRILLTHDSCKNPEISDFLKNHALIKSDPLDPRDAFFGDRTGNIATRYEITNTEKICYVDVCSLYSYVLKTGFPSYPDIYIGEECSELISKAPNINFDSVEGLVLSPCNLFHPVLP